MNFIRPFVITAFAVALMSVQTLASQADHSRLKHCGEGEVQAALQALEIGVVKWDPFEEGNQAGLGSYYDCQYRLWSEYDFVTEEPWTFCEHDQFLGASASRYPYEAFPFCSQNEELCEDDADCPLGETCINTAREVAAIFDGIVETVSFGPADGELEEQKMLRTTNKIFHDPVDGNVIWFQNGFIARRPPGTYRSDFSSYQNGELVDALTVYIEVVSHEVHQARVSNGTWK